MFPTVTNERTCPEIVTPHKIALLVLIKTYADITDHRHESLARIVWLDDEVVSKRRLNKVLLTWVQQPDGILKNILDIVGSSSRFLYVTYVNTLQNLCEAEDPQKLEDFFQDLSKMLADPSEENLLQRGGVLGLFCRRMILHYEKLLFCQLGPLHESLVKYCSIILSKQNLRLKRTFTLDSTENDDAALGDGNKEKNDSFDEMELESQSELDSKSSDESGMELKPSDLKTNRRADDLEASDMFTSQQADFFFAQQAAMITEKETMAMSPLKLQNKIDQILKNNHCLTEAHYLSYLNSLRVREFCGAVDSLLTYFNRHTKLPKTNNDDQKVASTAADDTSKLCRFAALNMALLHYHFGHKRAALAAAREAVDLSQLASDTQCLQHAMSLMCELDPDKVKLSLLEHQIKPAKQMNLIRLATKAIQRDANKQALQGKRPGHIFMLLTASECLARTRAIESLSPMIHVHKGALWRMYGKRHMSALYCQLALSSQGSSHLSRSQFPWQPNTEEIALALCHLVELLHESGNISASQEVLRHAKQRFPKITEHSKLWQLTELRLKHVTAIRTCRYSEAIQAEHEMVSLDREEAEYRSAERLFVSGDNVKAHTVLQRLLKTTDVHEEEQNEAENRQCTPELQCHVYLLLGRVLFTNTSDDATSLNYLLKALTIATRHYFHSLVVESKLLIAQLQLYSNMPNLAHQTLESCRHECLSNGMLMEQSRKQVIEANYILGRTKCISEKELKQCIDLVSNANRGFEILQDFHRQKDSVYLLARLHHQLFTVSENSMNKETLSETIAKRNKFASEFKNLDSLTFSSTCAMLI